MEKIKLSSHGLPFLREMDSRLVSYNIEMTEVTGGTFWKLYTPGQIEGREEVPQLADLSQMGSLLEMFPPADLQDQRALDLAKALGPAYIRVSGSWATTTYYDLDGRTNGKVPEGFHSILTRDQWDRLLDFVKYADGKLLISPANCDGVRNPDGTWNPGQLKLLLDYSRDYGVPVSAVEFMNEPNTTILGGTPSNYTAEDFSRDQDLCFRFLKENYPEVLTVGPCSSGEKFSPYVGYHNLSVIPSEDLLEGCKEQADVYSYHMYNCFSERGAFLGVHWPGDKALSEEYLGIPWEAACYYKKLRDQYCPGAQMWVTESGDAGCGGNTWASTFLDVIRSADELGRFCTVTDGVIFHNTFMASDYGYLDFETHLPRPNYWLVLLWNRLMGAKVYDSGQEIREGFHCYVHSRKDGKKGYAYMIVNNSSLEAALVELPCKSTVYALTADYLRSPKLLLNGKPLELTGTAQLPPLEGKMQEAGTLSLAPASVTFLVLEES